MCADVYVNLLRECKGYMEKVSSDVCLMYTI